MGMFTLLFVTAVSIDSFGIGCVLGMKGIRIALHRIVIIAFLSGGVFWISSLLGGLFLPFVSQKYTELLGAWAFIAMGIYFLWQYFKEKQTPLNGESIWINPSRVLNHPEAADVDGSGGIKGKEVWILGTALALDTVGAGVSGAFIGVFPVLTACLIMTATCLMLLAGILSGAKLSEKAEGLAILPGVLLIIIGLIKLA